ncbi:hypothetical protein F4680DRAFT_442958 [Xylaria scruposa]|nr:hypothetical protein F4680DRAFT_442958 [Xylaria scruposa]
MKYATAALGLLSATLSAAAPTTTAGYAVPSILKVHSINDNSNTQGVKTSTVRSGTFETNDDIEGTGSLDIFKNGFTDLATLNSGNLRDQQLARIVFNANTGLYDFKRSDFTPTIDSFPCPAGQTLHWEAAAVGTFDKNVVAQDFSYDGTHVPNGISVAWW